MLGDSLLVLTAFVLVALNGFYVATEFAFVKVRVQRLEELQRAGRPFAGAAVWLARRLDRTLAACQVGITMASLALGWVGEPAFARVLAPLFESAGVTSEALLHGISFAIAFGFITTLHIVAGEQVPKIMAIRRAEQVALACSVPMKVSYFLMYPLLGGLNWMTRILLRRFGVSDESEHESPHTEEEIRVLIRQARIAGELTRTEDRLLHAIFEFDDTVCRRIMLPRPAVVSFDVDQSAAECVEIARRTKHTRYPVCDGGLDRVLGIVHIKDMLGAGDDIDLRKIMRPPHYVPETMPISQLLRHFQGTKQLLALVVDEFGNLIGMVTLENVLEQIVGPVEDEFDSESPSIVPSGDSQFVIEGTASILDINKRTGLLLSDEQADTLSGLLAAHLGRIPQDGDEVALAGATAVVLDANSSRARKVRLTLAAEGAQTEQGA